MDITHIGQAIVDGFTYDAIKGAVMALVMTAAVQYMLGPVFHLLQERKQMIGFAVASFILFFALASLIGSRTAKPDLEGGISQVLTGPSETNNRQTVAVLEINVLNKGHMQTILKQWKVEATSNGSQYTGAFFPMPEKIAFNNIPRHPNGIQPTVVAYVSSDNILPKSVTPIPIGGQLSGILPVLFDNVDSNVFRTGVLFTVTFQDVFSREYKMEIRATGQPSLITFNPALNTETACPIPTAPNNDNITTSKLPPLHSPPQPQIATPVPPNGH